MDRTPSGITNLDKLIEGGFPKGRTMLVAGGAGCGKTIFSLQFVYSGAVLYDEPGVYVSFEQPVDEVVRDAQRFGWDFEEIQRNKKLALLDYSAAKTRTTEVVVESPEFNLNPLIKAIEFTAKEVGAKRVVLDSITALLLQFRHTDIVRRELQRVSSALKRIGCTTVLTSEVPRGQVGFGRFGVEEFVVDGVIVLQVIQKGLLRFRCIEITKMRGTKAELGLRALGITESGMIVYPEKVYTIEQLVV
ncbi:MAG: ATPase domain-containing protein [Promethearchaeati archaeon SRVP18_Atabeyarchaeia-1]